MHIENNILRYYLRNIYFITGTAYAGKSTMVKMLQKKYENQIEVKIGLECEFLPSMMNFYDELKEKADLNLLIIGQHFYEHSSLKYSFEDEEEFNRANEFSGCGNAIIQKK